MSSSIAGAIPAATRPTDVRTGLISESWLNWLRALDTKAQQALDLGVVFGLASEAPTEPKNAIYISDDGVLMPATLKKVIEGTLLTGAAVKYYTVPANQKLKLTLATVTNQDASPHFVSLYLVPSGGAPSPANLIVNAQPVPEVGISDTGPIALNVNHLLDTGGEIWAFADAPAVLALNVTGVLI